jgi:hypothetical protein
MHNGQNFGKIAGAVLQLSPIHKCSMSSPLCHANHMLVWTPHQAKVDVKPTTQPPSGHTRASSCCGSAEYVLTAGMYYICQIMGHTSNQRPTMKMMCSSDKPPELHTDTWPKFTTCTVRPKQAWLTIVLLSYFC